MMNENKKVNEPKREINFDASYRFSQEAMKKFRDDMEKDLEERVQRNQHVIEKDLKNLPKVLYEENQQQSHRKWIEVYSEDESRSLNEDGCEIHARFLQQKGFTTKIEHNSDSQDHDGWLDHWSWCTLYVKNELK